MYNTYF